MKLLKILRKKQIQLVDWFLPTTKMVRNFEINPTELDSDLIVITYNDLRKSQVAKRVAKQIQNRYNT